jgi:hypothetical protein
MVSTFPRTSSTRHAHHTPSVRECHNPRPRQPPLSAGLLLRLRSGGCSRTPTPIPAGANPNPAKHVSALPRTRTRAAGDIGGDPQAHALSQTHTTHHRAQDAPAAAPAKPRSAAQSSRAVALAKSSSLVPWQSVHVKLTKPRTKTNPAPIAVPPSRSLRSNHRLTQPST